MIRTLFTKTIQRSRPSLEGLTRLPFFSARALHRLRHLRLGFLDHLMIQHKLLLMSLLTGVLPLLLFFAMSMADSENMLTDEAMMRGNLFARVTSDRIATYFENRSTDALTLASSELVREGLADFNAFSLDQGEKQALAGRFGSFFQAPTEAHGYTDIFLTNQYGEIIYSQNYDPLDLAPLVFDGQFTERAMTGEQNWTEPFRNTFIDDNLMILATPVYGTSEKVQGTLNIVLNQSKIDAIVTNGIEEHGESARAYLIDEEGLLLTHLPHAEGTALLSPLDSGDATEVVRGILVENGHTGPFTSSYSAFDDRQVIGTIDTVLLGEDRVGLVIELDTVEAYATLDDYKEHMVLFVTLLGLFSFGLAYAIARSISEPLKAVTRSADEMASLRLQPTASPVKRKDEIGTLQASMDRINTQLIDMIGELRQASGTLGTASRYLALGAEESSRASTEVAISLEKVAGATHEQAQDAAHGAEKTKALADILEVEKRQLEELIHANRTMDQQINDGSEITGALKEHTLQMTATHQEIQERIASTHTSAQKIGEVTGYIRTIAEQTNLLSLNASIEAARAGKQGAGFAVVAGEIKKLSDDAKQATASIEALIRSLGKETGEAVTTLDTLLTHAAVQSDSVEQTLTIFSSIGHSLMRSKGHLQDLQTSGKEVDGLRLELKKDIEHLSSLTRDTSANTSEITAATQEQTATAESVLETSVQIDRLSDLLGTLIDRFQIQAGDPTHA